MASTVLYLSMNHHWPELINTFVAGVLVTGIGGATKVLQQFISCRKSYEAVALFGCSTDTYDAEGRVLRRAPYQHITRETVEEALNAFRGDIMQKPPMYVPLILRYFLFHLRAVVYYSTNR